MPEAFDVPQDLSELTDEELAALEQSGMERIDAMLAEENPDLAEMEQVATAIEVVRAERQSRSATAAEAEQDRVTRLDSIRQRVHPEGGEEGEQPAEQTAEVEQPAQEAEPVGAGVSASSQRYANIALLRRGNPTPPARQPEQPSVVITASADVPGFSAGSHLSLDALAMAIHNRVRSLDDGQKAIVASIHVPYDDEHMLTGDMAHDAAVLDAITNPALIASGGGWCAPLETLYGFFDISAADGLVDVPSVGARRGGVQYPKSPSLADTDPATGGSQGFTFFNWNEAADKAGFTAPTNSPSKPCMRIPCPTWVSCVLQADGICITHGNLMDRAFPELTRHYVSLVQKGHAHYMSYKKMVAMQTLSTSVDLSAFTTSDAVGNLANVLSLTVEWYRNKYRMSQNATLEAVIPHYVKEALRADLAMRAGVLAWNVSDAEIASFFSNRNVRAQWVQDYPDAGGAGIPVTATKAFNPAAVTTVGAETKTDVTFPVNATPAWPATTEFLLFPAGTFVAFDGGTLDLGVQRDSVLNATNDFTLAWTEQFWCLGMPGHESLKVKVALQVDGVTGCCA